MLGCELVKGKSYALFICIFFAAQTQCLEHKQALNKNVKAKQWWLFLLLIFTG